MVYRRKRTYRKKRTTKKMYSSRRMLYKRNRLNLIVTRDSIRDSVNQCHIAVIGSATGVISPLTSIFQLSDMAGHGEMKSLFDNYVIKKVAWRWVLARDADYTTTNPGSFVRIVQVKDYNDQVAPASSALLRQYSNSQEVVFKGNQDRTKWFYIKPASLALFYQGIASNSTGPVWNRLIDTSQDTVPHYGIKYSVENLYTGATLRLEVKITAGFKGIS